MNNYTDSQLFGKNSFYITALLYKIYRKEVDKPTFKYYSVGNMKRLYFDWAGTARPDPDIHRQTLTKSLESFGNPSSAYKEGKAAGALLEECRSRIARILNAKPEQIIFTSGGTESNNLVLFSLVNRKKAPGGLVISPFEHPSVFEPARALKELGWTLGLLPPLKGGRFDTESLTKIIRPETEMISTMAVNNENGLILPVREIARNIKALNAERKQDIFFHTDGVQALGKIPVDLSAWDADAVSFSGHKIGAPRGIGLLYLKKPRKMLNRGGGQEMDLRSGTENLFGIYGLTLALEKRYSEMNRAGEAAFRLKEYLVTELKKQAGARILPGTESVLSDEYSPWLLLVSFPSIPGEVLARVMNDRGAAVSTGSACAARKKRTYRVSDGLGISRRDAFSAIRISWGPGTSLEECETLIKIFKSETSILRR